MSINFGAERLTYDVVFVCQFALLLWVLTYIGGWFNGMTLLIIGEHLSVLLTHIYSVISNKSISAHCRRYAAIHLGIHMMHLLILIAGINPA